MPSFDIGFTRTHTVENQPGERTVDLWGADAPLRLALAANGGPAGAVRHFAHAMSSPNMMQCGREANRYPPELRQFDRSGRRVDDVSYHPAYHTLLGTALTAGYSAIAWEGEPGGHVAHAAMVYCLSQIEPGVCCPMTMTYAAIPALGAESDLAEQWRPRLTARGYDPAMRPVDEKPAATLGMAMTEKQGGSDIRATTTKAVPDDGAYRLTGHKWFCSAPMSDGFLTLAQAPGGLTCFLVPRWLEGGPNAIQLMRLKEKLGNRSNATAEIEYLGAVAHRLGDEGEGVRTIIEMVHHTRLDTAMAPAGLMRAALAEATHWCTHRTAFQRKLVDQPLMRVVLADLALDVEAALALGMRVARAFDGGTPDDRGFARVAVALAKFLNNKRCPGVIYECMECLGGMGYTDATPLPMLYRAAPLNSIWEGSGNVICLDVLRTLGRDPASVDALHRELDDARGANGLYDAELDSHLARWSAAPSEAEARWYTERTATLLAGASLLKSAPSAVSDGYIATRVCGRRGRTAGSVAGLDETAILGRVLSPD